MTLSDRGFLLATFICAILAALVFLPGLPGDFLLDDISNIVQNQAIHLTTLNLGAALDAAFSTQMGGATRVVPTLSFALDHARGGLDPATFKATNIAIHALTTMLVAGFLRQLLFAAGVGARRAGWAALAMALAWAMHPLQVSAVLYIVQRMQTLATLFVVLALWCYLGARQAQMDGRPSRTFWLLAGLSWAFALGSKEDTVLVPVYMLALELTVLRFRAADQAVAQGLRRGFMLLAGLGVAAFLLVVVPRFWSWEMYAGRDFSSFERLVTQGRVLCLYLWQMLVPLPSHMPFYYDWLSPSRGILQPWTTLPAWLALAAWMAFAWRRRHLRPLFALGTFLFFGSHLVASNVVGLELAFEHRNHFSLLGVALATGDLLAQAASRLRLQGATTAAVPVILLTGLGAATVARAASWESGLRFALTSTQIAPMSARAWNGLCLVYFEQGGGERKNNPNLDKAIAACAQGVATGADSITSLTNILVFKGLQGAIPQADWDLYQERISRVTMSAEATSRIWVLMDQVRKGLPLDRDEVEQAIATFHRRAPFRPVEATAAGYFLLGHGRNPSAAYPYFEHALRTTRDPVFTQRLLQDLRDEGYSEWAERLGR